MRQLLNLLTMGPSLANQALRIGMIAMPNAIVLLKSECANNNAGPMAQNTMMSEIDSRRLGGSGSAFGRPSKILTKNWYILERI
jgi:hypothetical protein